MRKVTKDTKRIYDIWVNLVQELQVKSEVVILTMKTNWENRVCSPKADLVKFLDNDNDHNDTLVFPLATCMPRSEPECSPLGFAGRTGSGYGLPQFSVSHIWSLLTTLADGLASGMWLVGISRIEIRQNITSLVPMRDLFEL